LPREPKTWGTQGIFGHQRYIGSYKRPLIPYVTEACFPTHTRQYNSLTW